MIFSDGSLQHHALVLGAGGVGQEEGERCEGFDGKKLSR